MGSDVGGSNYRERCQDGHHIHVFFESELFLQVEKGDDVGEENHRSFEHLTD